MNVAYEGPALIGAQPVQVTLERAWTLALVHLGALLNGLAESLNCERSSALAWAGRNLGARALSGASSLVARVIDAPVQRIWPRRHFVTTLHARPHR